MWHQLYRSALPFSNRSERRRRRCWTPPSVPVGLRVPECQCWFAAYQLHMHLEAPRRTVGVLAALPQYRMLYVAEISVEFAKASSHTSSNADQNIHHYRIVQLAEDARAPRFLEQSTHSHPPQPSRSISHKLDPGRTIYCRGQSRGASTVYQLATITRDPNYTIHS